MTVGNHNQITKHAAVSLLNKIESADAPIGVFANGAGSYTTTKVTTDAFKNRLEKYPHTFVGVFDINVSLSLLEDELAAVNVK